MSKLNNDGIYNKVKNAALFLTDEYCTFLADSMIMDVLIWIKDLIIKYFPTDTIRKIITQSGKK